MVASERGLPDARNRPTVSRSRGLPVHRAQIRLAMTASRRCCWHKAPDCRHAAPSVNDGTASLSTAKREIGLCHRAWSRPWRKYGGRVRAPRRLLGSRGAGLELGPHCCGDCDATGRVSSSRQRLGDPWRAASQFSLPRSFFQRAVGSRPRSTWGRCGRRPAWTPRQCAWREAVRRSPPSVAPHPATTLAKRIAVRATEALLAERVAQTAWRRPLVSAWSPPPAATVTAAEASLRAVAAVRPLPTAEAARSARATCAAT